MGKIIKAEKGGGIESKVIEEHTPLFFCNNYVSIVHFRP